MAAQERPQRRTSNPTVPRPHVRLSVPVPVEVHAKLAALAILRGLDRSELAASFLEASLRGVVIQERGGGDPSSPADGAAGL